MATIQCKNITFDNIQAIFFDKNGTLEDSEVYLRSLGQKAARIIDAQFPGIGEPLLMAYGIDSNSLDLAGLMAVGSRRETEIATAAYIAETGRGWFESLKIARQSFQEAEKYLEASPAPLLPGSLELLQSLSAAGLKLGIISAATTAKIQAFATRYNLGDYLQAQIGVDDGPGKPDPTLFLQACEVVGVEPSAALMVGDAVGDMLMAKNAKAAGCIGITWIGQSDHVQGADVVINQLSEIKVLE
ncbi:HAD family hydrolase [Nostoc sp. FACHB-87]|uniref:HAD family hydrolase n=1 Tax=Nostocales TaxID=1161 RepID=UPI0016889100|nr:MULTISPECIES: HAD family hydrolase [Nostocales]MBD2452530.1 HAD family hydrolase [Nostoc sp. FACHB-87]MBD2473461.1 HAD family hydrolase [Anabaena sp. FACHB-83]MBD2486128.1 HAD family hydrolase [Aulosira sp. FACHB-615]